MTSCSTAPAARPHGVGQCAIAYPESRKKPRLLGFGRGPVRLDERADLGTVGLRFRRQLDRVRALDPSVDETGDVAVDRRRSDRTPPPRDRALQVDVRVVLPGEADAAVQLDVLLRTPSRTRATPAPRRPRPRARTRAYPGSVRAASHTGRGGELRGDEHVGRRCFTAWKTPMTRPNCSRTLAYSLAMVTHRLRAAGRLGGGEHATERDRRRRARRVGPDRRPRCRRARRHRRAECCRCWREGRPSPHVGRQSTGRRPEAAGRGRRGRRRARERSGVGADRGAYRAVGQTGEVGRPAGRRCPRRR